MLPKSTFAHRMLKKLELLQIEISILPNSISALINFDWLSLSQSKVTTRLASIGAFELLRILNLS